ncbi:MAG TPA: GNAT family N-acetyltransferase [Candidatus Dormibacteraeota bacterium]|jgi:GNAT superfamily N-acetyltransferase|nr:GNAT family N-acetyltransferase [Candidatus Dormibacteraeota bacterium]
MRSETREEAPPQGGSDPRLVRHLETWLGAWPPPPSGFAVAESAARTERRPWSTELLIMRSPLGTVVSVPPGLRREVEAIGRDVDDPAYRRRLARALGRPGAGIGTLVFRWSVEPAPLEPLGEWVAPGDERIPDWLRPFDGEVLIHWDEEGRYGAGVGRKRHDDSGQELAVVTEPSMRGRGVARRLVAAAAERVIAEGAVPTYLHTLDNLASARVADSAGFPDLGWRLLSLW